MGKSEQILPFVVVICRFYQIYPFLSLGSNVIHVLYRILKGILPTPKRHTRSSLPTDPLRHSKIEHGYFSMTSREETARRSASLFAVLIRGTQ